MYCKKCGTELKDGVNHCEICGEEMAACNKNDMTAARVILFVTGIVWILVLFLSNLWTNNSLGEKIAYSVVDNNGLFSIIKYALGLFVGGQFIWNSFIYEHLQNKIRIPLIYTILSALIVILGIIFPNVLSLNSEVVAWGFTMLCVSYLPAAAITLVMMIILFVFFRSGMEIRHVEHWDYNIYKKGVIAWLILCLIASIGGVITCVLVLTRGYIYLFMLILYIFRTYSYIEVLNHKRTGMYILISCSLIEAAAWTIYAGLSYLTAAPFLNLIITSVVIAKYWRNFK